MNISYILLSFFIFLQPINFNVTGDWETEGSNFSLTLMQSGNSIKGHYCAIANDGNRIDCYTDDSNPCEMSGRFIDMKAKVSFTSCYMGATGKATLTYNLKTDKLIWKLEAVEGEVFAPDSAVLTRKKTSR